MLYLLDEVLLLCLLAMLAGSETITDFVRFGDEKLAVLRCSCAVSDSTVARDHLGDVPAWVTEGSAEVVGQDVTVSDGKTS